MVNDKGVSCITGYHNLGDASKDALIKREGYMVSDKGVRTSAAHTRLGNKGAEARSKNARATALGEHHSHMRICVLWQRGASVTWQGENA